MAKETKTQKTEKAKKVELKDLNTRKDPKGGIKGTVKWFDARKGPD